MKTSTPTPTNKDSEDQKVTPAPLQVDEKAQAPAQSTTPGTGRYAALSCVQKQLKHQLFLPCIIVPEPVCRRAFVWMVVSHLLLFYCYLFYLSIIRVLQKYVCQNFSWCKGLLLLASDKVVVLRLKLHLALCILVLVLAALCLPHLIWTIPARTSPPVQA